MTVVESCGWWDCSWPHYGQRFVLGGDDHVAPTTVFCPGASNETE